MKGVGEMQFVYEQERLIGQLSFGELYTSTNPLKGYKPYELLLASLTTCSGSLLVMLLQKMRLHFVEVSFTSEGHRNPEMANRIEAIVITAHVSFNEEVKGEQLAKLEKLVVKNCGMIQTVIEAVDIKFTIVPATAKGKKEHD